MVSFMYVYYVKDFRANVITFCNEPLKIRKHYFNHILHLFCFGKSDDVTNVLYSYLQREFKRLDSELKVHVVHTCIINEIRGKKYSRIHVKNQSPVCNLYKICIRLRPTSRDFIYFTFNGQSLRLSISLNINVDVLPLEHDYICLRYSYISYMNP